jgi:hypothetical protein
MEGSRLRSVIHAAYAAVVAASISACAGSGLPAQSPALKEADVRQNAGALGPVVSSQFGGEIFGWDIDQNGDDGVLSETAFETSGKLINAIETFDQSTGKITKVVQKQQRLNADVEPVVDAIAGSDVGIVDVERLLASDKRDDYFDLLNPVSGNTITGRTQPPGALGVVPSFVTNNQASSNQVMMFYDLRNGFMLGGMYTYDTEQNAWGKRQIFSENDVFNNGFPIYAAIDSATNEAVTGFLGRARYNPHESPTFDVVDAATGRQLRSFYGVGYGFPNGIAIDPTTDVMCTTTTGDMDVEFYDLATGKGKAVQIPVFYTHGGSETGGAAVAADPVHHLFLVAQINSTFSPSSISTVIVYDEHGKLVEYINGFDFFFYKTVIVPHLAVNPSARTGYVNGPTPTELQEFSY